MRKDIKEIMKMYKKEGIKPNFSQVARRYNCDYRTVKRYYDEDEKPGIMNKWKKTSDTTKCQEDIVNKNLIL